MTDKDFTGYLTIRDKETGETVNIPADIYKRLKQGEIQPSDLRCFSRKEREIVMNGVVESI